MIQVEDESHLAVESFDLREGFPSSQRLYRFVMDVANHSNRFEKDAFVSWTVFAPDGHAKGTGLFTIGAVKPASSKHYQHTNGLLGLEIEPGDVITVSALTAQELRISQAPLGELSSTSSHGRACGGPEGVSQQNVTGTCIAFCEACYARAAICAGGVDELSCDCDEDRRACRIKCSPPSY
ncbi:MAG: hypothetical protein DWQ36_06065 [Acidobacteria bacterium]|nr:MAG: hypothetical protein DWQ30_19070 [Acidobacteriota bacterium]REK09613.1 MAG: hypothetical protein DWQ36_06065 [Acidobacteriota bacterium]